MSFEALLRFLVLGVLCCALIEASEAELPRNVPETDQQEPAPIKETEDDKADLGSREDEVLDDSDDSDDDYGCPPAPLCPEGYGLVKTEEISENGCAMFQCIHPLPEVGSNILQPTNRGIFGRRCVLPKCRRGFKPTVLRRNRPRGCPRVLCLRRNLIPARGWRSCQLHESEIDTFDGRVLNCAKACAITLVRERRVAVMLIRKCNKKGTCYRHIRLVWRRSRRRPTVVTLDRKLLVNIRGYKFNGKRLRKLNRYFPFYATRTGDTLIFTARKLGIQIIWNKYMHGSIRIRSNYVRRVQGACNFSGGKRKRKRKAEKIKNKGIRKGSGKKGPKPSRKKTFWEKFFSIFAKKKKPTKKIRLQQGGKKGKKLRKIGRKYRKKRRGSRFSLRQRKKLISKRRGGGAKKSSRIRLWWLKRNRLKPSWKKRGTRRVISRRRTRRRRQIKRLKLRRLRKLRNKRKWDRRVQRRSGKRRPWWLKRNGRRQKVGGRIRLFARRKRKFIRRVGKRNWRKFKRKIRRGRRFSKRFKSRLTRRRYKRKKFGKLRGKWFRRGSRRIGKRGGKWLRRKWSRGRRFGKRGVKWLRRGKYKSRKFGKQGRKFLKKRWLKRRKVGKRRWFNKKRWGRRRTKTFRRNRKLGLRIKQRTGRKGIKRGKWNWKIWRRQQRRKTTSRRKGSWRLSRRFKKGKLRKRTPKSRFQWKTLFSRKWSKRRPTRRKPKRKAGKTFRKKSGKRRKQRKRSAKKLKKLGRKIRKGAKGGRWKVIRKRVSKIYYNRRSVKLAKNSKDHLKSWSSNYCGGQKCSRGNRLHAWRLCQLFRRAPFSKCKAVMDTCSFERRCQVTACRCLHSRKGWQRCKCDLMTVFAKECLRAKSLLKPLLVDGLKKHRCFPKCGSQYVYNLCIKDSCQQKCSTLKKRKCSKVRNMCATGCHCPSGLVMKAHRCVRKEHCRECQCSGSTDGTHETFDKQPYMFKGKCTYLALRDKKNTVRIFVTYKYCNDRNPRTRCMLILNIRIMSLPAVKILKWRNVVIMRVGRRRYGFPYRFKQLRVRRIKGGISILHKQIQLEVLVYQDISNPNIQNFKINLPVSLYKRRKNPTEGLCGVCQGPGKRGKVLNLKVRDKPNSNSVKKFTRSWLAKYIAKQYKREKQCRQLPPSPCKHTDRQNKKICEKLKYLKWISFRHCNINHNYFIRKCKQLICSKKTWRQKKTLGCKIIEEYASKCCAARKMISNWRRWAGCPRIRCKRGTGKVYKVCGPGCDKTCKRKRCSLNIKRQEGCYCRRGRRWNGKKCIWRRRCPICNGRILGERWRDLKKCKRCHCRAGGKIVCRRLCPKGPQRCNWDKKLKYVRRYGKCCKRCVCRRRCPRIKRPTCKKSGQVPVVKRTRHCNCLYYVCKCIKRTCLPKKRCTRYQIRKIYKVKNSCCHRSKCECIGSKRCPRRRKPNCRWDSKRVRIYDRSRCCVIRYHCRCRCKLYKVPVCRRDQRLVRVRSYCRCKRFVCKCKPCPRRPYCGRYATIKKYKEVDRCCPTYECECKRKRCPAIRRIRKCKKAYVLKKKWDRRKCCILAFSCVCKKCKSLKRLKCKKHEKLVVSRNRCGCRKFTCVCDKMRCPRIPRCTRYQYRREVKGGAKPCCRYFECVCRGLKRCPRARRPRCRKFMKIKKIYDRNGCCVVRRTCTCAGVKCRARFPRCGKFRKLRIKREACGCFSYKCRCVKTRCPMPKCTRYQFVVKSLLKRHKCCPKRYCVCLPHWRCPRLVKRVPKCKRGQRLIPVKDKSNCCVAYYVCACRPCKRPKPIKCKRFQTRTVKISRCGCRKYTCKCRRAICPKAASKNCGRYSRTISYYKKRGDCCKIHVCRCDRRRCPRGRRRIGPKCKDEQVLFPVFDRSKCCVIHYRCRCRRKIRCKLVSKRYCGLAQKLIYVRSLCGCKKPTCVCRGNLCPARPKCGRNQVLKKMKYKSNKCCSVYKCACIKRWKCPRVPKPRCGKEMKQKEIYDSSGCCVITKHCICSRCRPKRRPKCPKYMRLQNKPTKCCNYLTCVCNRASCPVKKCSKHQRITEYPQKGRCCPRQRCICDPKRCPVQTLRLTKSCPTGQIIRTRLTKDRCCREYYCTCGKCPVIRIRRCGKRQKRIKINLPCGCKKYKCICDKRKCPRRPPCSFYQTTLRSTPRKKCCPTIRCICDRSRCKYIKPNPTACRAEERLTPVLDHSKCCVVKYKCVCGRCKQRKLPACQKYERLVVYRSRCGCRKPVCKCDRKTRCPAAPVCSKYQKLRVTSRKGSCCKRYKCVCKGASACPRIRTPRCKQGEKIKAAVDRNNCCEVRRFCKCLQKLCPALRIPRCGRYMKRKLVKSRCCRKYICVCNRRFCPKKRCTKYQTRYTGNGLCCPKQFCKCDPRRCPRRPKLRKCPKGMKNVPVTDRKKCCILGYRCKCVKCPFKHPRKICGRNQKVVFKITRCRCRVPKCVCDKKKCPRKKNCGRYRMLKIKILPDSCCKEYNCVCNKRSCRRYVRRVRCPRGKVAVPVTDRNRCCVTRYRCKCKRCPRVRRRPCERYEKVVFRKTVCGCRYPTCVCNNAVVCPARPRCSKHEKMITSRTSNRCCKRYECVCKGVRYCPRRRRPRCTREQKLVTVKGKCCILRRYCKCNRCPPMKMPKCRPNQRLRSKPSKCCIRFICECDKSRCPVKKCRKHERKFVYKVKKRCCPVTKCVCAPWKCPQKPSKLKCRSDQYLKVKLDKWKCCKKYRCTCRRCRAPRKIRCKMTQKVVVRMTRCRCRKYKCICDRHKCKRRPKCNKFSKLTVIRKANKCCPSYRCDCVRRSKCPRVKANYKKCKDEQYLKPIYDSSHCCIKRWKCVCGNCKPITIPPCSGYQKIEYDESACNCPKPQCVCKERKHCKPKPICNKYQVLVGKNTTDPCCRKYECQCKKLSQCPKVPTPNCKEEEVVQDVTDNNDCCVVKKRCVCPKVCPPIKTPICKKGKRMVRKERKCCVKYICICDETTCPRKSCGKCLIAVTSKFRKGCCPVERCVCNSKCCPKVNINPSKCKAGQKLKAVRDRNLCCVLRYVCVCKKCKPTKIPRCKRSSRLSLTFTRCGCRIYRCICNKRSCRRPPTCGKYETKVATLPPGSCCLRYRCRCNMTKCPKLKINPKKCKDEQKFVPVKDKKKCCIIRFRCKCTKCKPPKKIKCPKYKKLRIARTVCGCKKPECICSKKKCPRVPKCTKYQEMRSFKVSKCCTIHKCVCKGIDKCPKVKVPKCKDEQKVVERVDRNRCCVIRKRCRCPRRCRKYRWPRCKKYQRITWTRTKCCKKPKCVCSRRKCKRAPRCKRFEKLKKIYMKGKCCPKYQCKPSKGCVVMDKRTRQYLLKKENSTWKDNSCISCKCEKPGVGFEIKCIAKKCQKCRKPNKAVKVRGHCCPKCVPPEMCVVSGGRATLKPGFSWTDGCTTYKCEKKFGIHLITFTKKTCPLKVLCIKNKSPDLDGCHCETCGKPSCKKKVIPPKTTIGRIKVKNNKGKICKNKGKIYGLTECKGSCDPTVKKENEKRDIEKTCRSLKTKIISATLTCPDGKTIKHFIKVPVSCTCKNTCKCKP